MQYNLTPKSQLSPEMEQFIKLVGQMRTSQKDYFRDRSRTKLNECKKLEREVDEKIKQLATKHT